MALVTPTIHSTEGIGARSRAGTVPSTAGEGRRTASRGTARRWVGRRPGPSSTERWWAHRMAAGVTLRVTRAPRRPVGRSAAGALVHCRSSREYESQISRRPGKSSATGCAGGCCHCQPETKQRRIARLTRPVSPGTILRRTTTLDFVGLSTYLAARGCPARIAPKFP